MKIYLPRRSLPFLAVLFMGLLSGCISQQLYYWGSYEDQLYGYFKGEDRQNQIAALKKDEEKMAASGKKAPPGFYAHLGMLYAEAGGDAEAITCFETEKSLFPEAAGFMDYLLKRYGR